MYAVIRTGGKQHRVKPGDVIEIELVQRGQEQSVTFTPILVVDDEGKAHVGRELGGATVRARLLGEQKGEKVRIFKYRPKTGYAKRQGHRQMHTLVEIEDVSLGGAARQAPAKEARPEPAQEVEAAAGRAEPSPSTEGGAGGVTDTEGAAGTVTATESTPSAGEETKGVFSMGTGAAGEEEFATEDASPRPSRGRGTAAGGSAGGAGTA